MDTNDYQIILNDIETKFMDPTLMGIAILFIMVVAAVLAFKSLNAKGSGITRILALVSALVGLGVSFHLSSAFVDNMLMIQSNPVAEATKFFGRWNVYQNLATFFLLALNSVVEEL